MHFSVSRGGKRGSGEEEGGGVSLAPKTKSSRAAAFSRSGF